MKTRTTPIEQLKPGDKIYIPRAKKASSTFPEILSVKGINLKESTIDIEESGGFALKSKHFELVINKNITSTKVELKVDQLSFFD